MPPSSPIFAPCRLDWRPSRWLAGALGLLMSAAIWAVWQAGAPPWLAALLSGYALIAGCWALRTGLAAPARHIVIPWSDAPASVDGIAVDALQVHWRGPIALLAWRTPEGRHACLHFWPDVLPPAGRRELRLAAQARAISSRRSLVAP